GGENRRPCLTCSFLFLRVLCSSIIGSFAGFGLAQNHAKVSSPEGKALFYAPRNGDLAAVARYAIVLAKHPQAAGSVIDLENAIAQSTERVRYRALNPDVLSREAPGVAIDIGDAGLCWTSCRQNHHCKNRRR